MEPERQKISMCHIFIVFRFNPWYRHIPKIMALHIKNPSFNIETIRFFLENIFLQGTAVKFQSIHWFCHKLGLSTRCLCWKWHLRGTETHQSQSGRWRRPWGWRRRRGWHLLLLAGLYLRWIPQTVTEHTHCHQTLHSNYHQVQF